MLKKIFKLSDLFILIGFLCTAFFMVFSFRYMETLEIAELPIHPAISISVFLIGATAWGFYIFFEYKAGNMPKRWITILCIFLLVFSVLGVIIQKDPFVITTLKGEHGATIAAYEPYYTLNGDSMTITLPVSMLHKLFFTLAIIQIITFMYAGFFIFPKRAKSLWVIRILGYIIFVFVTSLCIYSYIVEAGLYGEFLEKIFVEGIGATPVQSYILNSNAFGMSLLLGILFCCINHSLEKKWFYFPIMLVLLLQMFFTFCRTSLIISLILGPAYIIYNLVTTFRGHFKRNLFWSLAFGISFTTLVLLFIISAITDGAFIPYFNNAVEVFSSIGSLVSRYHIWEVTFEIFNVSPLYYFFGMGYGVINFELFHVLAIKDGWDAIPTHNSFIHLLAQGGLFMILLYIVFMVYVVRLIAKNWKYNHTLFYAITLGLISFTIYSFVETIQYLVYPFVLLVFIVINIYNNKEKQEIEAK